MQENILLALLFYYSLINAPVTKAKRKSIVNILEITVANINVPFATWGTLPFLHK